MPTTIGSIQARWREGAQRGLTYTAQYRQAQLTLDELRGHAREQRSSLAADLAEHRSIQSRPEAGNLSAALRDVDAQAWQRILNAPEGIRAALETRARTAGAGGPDLESLGERLGYVTALPAPGSLDVPSIPELERDLSRLASTATGLDQTQILAGVQLDAAQMPVTATVDELVTASLTAEVKRGLAEGLATHQQDVRRLKLVGLNEDELYHHLVGDAHVHDMYHRDSLENTTPAPAALAVAHTPLPERDDFQEAVAKLQRDVDETSSPDARARLLSDFEDRIETLRNAQATQQFRASSELREMSQSVAQVACASSYNWRALERELDSLGVSLADLMHREAPEVMAMHHMMHRSFDDTKIRPEVLNHYPVPKEDPLDKMPVPDGMGQPAPQRNVPQATPRR